MTSRPDELRARFNQELPQLWRQQETGEWVTCGEEVLYWIDQEASARSRTDQRALLERLESHVNHMKGFSDMPGFIDEELTRLEGEGNQ